MADIWMDVDTALSEVPVNIMPLVDDTDFKTRETSVAYNAAGMDLVWNFVTSAGATTQTAVTPTTAGNYDWTHQGDGMYTIEIPASGGASINNDTEGYGWFTGVATGVLPWRGPVIGFRAAAINDALCDGGDLLDVSVTQWLGTAAATPTTAGVPEVDVTHWTGTAVATPDTNGYPKVTVKSGTGTGEISLTSGAVKLTTNLKKNQALSNYHFLMTDSTNHAPATGLTVTATRAIDNGTFASGTLSSVTEISNGIYRLDFGAGDLNGNVVTLRCTATGADDLLITFITEP